MQTHTIASNWLCTCIHCDCNSSTLLILPWIVHWSMPWPPIVWHWHSFRHCCVGFSVKSGMCIHWQLTLKRWTVCISFIVRNQVHVVNSEILKQISHIAFFLFVCTCSLDVSMNTWTVALYCEIVSSAAKKKRWTDCFCKFFFILTKPWSIF